MSFGGLRVIVTEDALETTDVRLFPESKHRSARVKKKLIKRFGGEFRKIPTIFRTASTLFMHPVRYAELLVTLKENHGHT